MTGTEKWVLQATNYQLSYIQKLCLNILKAGAIPRHIAFIMDGNRRWARKQNLLIEQGHKKGYEISIIMMKCCKQLGIKECTIYAFSIENFKRTKSEVDNIMEMTQEIMMCILESIMESEEKEICFRFVGNFNLLNANLKRLFAEIAIRTRNNTKFIFNIALPYTSRDEIKTGIQDIMRGVEEGLISPQDITQQLINDCLYVNTPVDLLIRTSGEVRFSDFLLWQSTNAQLCFIDKLWPDMGVWDFFTIILKYQRSEKEKKDLQCETEYNSRIENFVTEVRKQRMQTIESYINI